MTIWRTYYQKLGSHVHCRLFAGPAEGALGLVGNLVFRGEEFTEFTRINKVIAMDYRRESDNGKLLGDDNGPVFDENLRGIVGSMWR